jgi:hypothetical protein
MSENIFILFLANNALCNITTIIIWKLIHISQRKKHKQFSVIQMSLQEFPKNLSQKLVTVRFSFAATFFELYWIYYLKQGSALPDRIESTFFRSDPIRFFKLSIRSGSIRSGFSNCRSDQIRSDKVFQKLCRLLIWSSNFKQTKSRNFFCKFFNTLMNNKICGSLKFSPMRPACIFVSVLFNLLVF